MNQFTRQQHRLVRVNSTELRQVAHLRFRNHIVCTGKRLMQKRLNPMSLGQIEQSSPSHARAQAAQAI
jgi:hypothetical protein